MRLMIFLFDSYQMANLPLMDQVSMTDKNKVKDCARNKTEVTLNTAQCSQLRYQI
jgi:hypothetical protein